MFGGRFGVLVLTGALVAGTACSDLFSSDPPVPGAIKQISSSNQIGTVDNLLPEPVAVRVVSRSGQPIPRVRVIWNAAPDAGQFESADLITDADGTARARWRLGTGAGSQRGTAEVDGVPAARLSAIAVAGPASQLELDASEISLEVGEAGGRLEPRFSDRFGNGASAPAGEQVWWSSSPDVVDVDAAGRLTALAEGEATVGLDAGELSAAASIQVTPSTLRATVHGAYLVQTVQSFGGDVPLIEGRPALLRFFATVSRDTYSASAPVRASFFLDGALAETMTLNLGSDRLPLALNEGMLNLSWNAVVSSELVRPGLAVVIELDPDGSLPLADRAGLQYPASGEPLAIDVRSAPPLRVTLVPVYTSATGLIGNVDQGSAPGFVHRARQLFPLNEVDIEVRTVYTTDVDNLQPDNRNAAWTQLLSEINALRMAEGSQRYYYGVVDPPYANGVAGFGYVPGRAAVGFDRMPAAADIFAHEIGHNFGRRHADCGGAPNPDPEFPYADGRIGVYGYDATAGMVRPPSAGDIMSYCYTWISDYSYNGVMDYREYADADAYDEAGGAGLLVWGRITDEGVTLEPAFHIDAPPSRPSGSGPYRLELLDADGGRLASWGFTPERVDHSTDSHFAFVVPVTDFPVHLLGALRVAGPAGEAGLRPVQAPQPSTPARMRGRGAERRLEWDGRMYPATLVRHPRTGEILGIARGGDARVRSDLDEVELVLSDGIRTRTERVRLESQ